MLGRRKQDTLKLKSNGKFNVENTRQATGDKHSQTINFKSSAKYNTSSIDSCIKAFASLLRYEDSYIHKKF